LPETDQFPFNLPLIQKLDEVEFTGPVTFFVGENGSGKSTLLEAIATGMDAITIGSYDVWEDPTLEAARMLGGRLRLVKNKKPHRGFYFRAEDAFGFTKRIIREQLELAAEEQEVADSVEGSGKTAAAGVIRAQRKKLIERYGDNPDACSHGEIRKISYDEVEHVMVMRGFLNNPETYLRHLSM
jgi:predicted ATPase